MLQLIVFMFSLALPLEALSECSLTRTTGDTLTVTFGAKCMRDESMKAALASDIKAQIETMNDVQPRKRSRSAMQQKLYNFSDMRDQADFLSRGPQYYGQQ